MRMNISEAIRTWAMRKGDKLAVSGSNKMTYSKLNSLVENLAKQIYEILPNGHQKIAILTKNNTNFIIFLLGIIRSGNIFVLINPGLSNAQINKSLKTIHCKYYISDFIEENLTANKIFFEDKESDLDDKTYLMYPSIGLTEDAGVIFSSGTTGEPKAILRNSFSIISEVVQWIIELQLQRGTSFLIPRPLYYTGGFILMYASLFSGGRVDLLDDISSDSILHYLQKETIDWAFIVPSAIREMNTNNNYNKMAKNVLTMGSPIYQSEKTMFYEKFHCNLIEVWGNSEGLGTITEPSDLFEHPFSIGRPFFTDYLDVAKKNDGENEGVLFGLSDNKFSEYIEKPELTDEVLKNGFIYSEDIGYKDDNDFFYLTGRTTDIIVINGIKVFPDDIEKVLLQENGILDCAVVGLKEKNGNEIVSAALVLKEEQNVKEIIKRLNQNLAPEEKILKYIVLKSIPRNHGGKTDKNIIKEYLKLRGMKVELNRLRNDS